MPFALESDPSMSDVSGAINYILSNFSTGLSSNAGTGEIVGPTGTIVGYLYKYMAVKYADNSTGTLNFSNTPTSRLYYGIRNSNSATESTNPADYSWNQVTGGFGTTKFLYYIATGGRQINFQVATSLPDTGWVIDGGGSIDLDVVTSGNIPVIVDSFASYFTPSILQVPRSGSPLVPSFTGITPVMYATNKSAIVPFTSAQTDSSVAFVNNSWRIGNSSTTGYGDISKTNITIGDPTDAGDYASWPNPTAMPNSPAYITVPVRYKDSTGVVAQASVATIQFVYADPGSNGTNGTNGTNASTIDISGFTGFNQNAAGAYTPPNATLSAVPFNITSPSYSWAISGATPTSSTSSSVVVTPTSSATSVVVTLTASGTNLLSPISKTITMPIVYNGVAGQAGSNGLMSAFPTIYQWTGSSTPPTRPTTTSTYTWSTGAYTPPSGWSTSAPSNTTAGNYLWSITFPLNVTATTTTSTLDWTSTANPIRAIAYNGTNGATGATGATGAAGSNGAATFVITRVANDSSAPTDAEVYALLGRYPVAGDIVTVSYNSYNNATIYRYVTSWILFNTYITGSLIVENTITGDKMVANTITADKIDSRNLTIRDASGTVLLGAGTNLAAANITPASAWLNANISINSNGTLSGAGSGAVTVAGLDNTILRSGNPINTTNISTYIASGAIGTAYIANAAITNALIADASITTAKIGAAAITSAKIGTAEVATLNIAGQAVTIPSSAYTAGPSTITAGNNVQSVTFTSSGNAVFITTSVSYLSISPTYAPVPIVFQIRRGSTVIYTGQGLFNGASDAFGNYPGSFTGSLTDTPSSGSQTYSLYFYSGGGDTGNTFNNMSIMCLEVKR